MGVLTAFQTNAQTRVRVLADTSGLATNQKYFSTVHDSFPNNKKGLHRWLSVNESGDVYVKSSKKDDSTSFRDELYPDKSGIFELRFHTPDSVNYRFSAGVDKPLTLRNTDGDPRSYFEIISVQTDGKRGHFSSYKTGNKPTGDTVSLPRKEGYLSSFTVGDSLKMDTINYSLVGAGKDGKLSIRKFNEFAIYGDSLPYAPFWKYQYDDNIRPGKLYQADSLHHFQLYRVPQDHVSVVSEAGNGQELFIFGGNTTVAANWGKTGTKANPNDPKVFTYLDIEVVDDHSIRLLDKEIRLDKIADIAADLKVGDKIRFTANSRIPAGGTELKGIAAKTATLPDALPEFGATKADSVAYLVKDDDGKLSFTVKTSGRWTAKTPTRFAGDKYYYIDTTFLGILPSILFHSGVDTTSTPEKIGVDTLFLPEKNRIPRYLYKNDDGWRPLYVRVEEVPDDAPLKYVGQQWVKDNRFHLSGALQKLVKTNKPGYISADEAGNAVVGSDSDEEYRFSFEFADSIKRTDNRINVTPTPDHVKFSNKDSIELFRISYANKYLTALKKTEFDVVSNDTSVANMQLGWEDKIERREESARQFFAIVRNSEDSSVTFLPVASYKRRLLNGAIKYEDTLAYNVGIGKSKYYGDESAKLDSIADLDGTTWSLIEWSGKRHLVVADSFSVQPKIWFGLEFPLKPWAGYREDGIASIMKVSNEKYYRGDGEVHEGSVTANDIRAHWKISKLEEEDEYKFTPVISNIYGASQSGPAALKDAGLTFSDGENVVILDKNGSKILDTVRVSYGINPEDFDLFSDIDNRVGKNVTIVSSAGDNISFGIKDDDNAHLASYSDDGTRATVHRSMRQWLDDDKLYEAVPYYIFSHKDEDGREYFLKADEQKVRWVSLSNEDRTALLESANAVIEPMSTPVADPYTPFKFALPAVSDKGVYLQALDASIKGSPRIIRIKGDERNELEYAEAKGDKTDEGIYGALDYYKNPSSYILSWKFNRALSAKWVPASEFDFDKKEEGGITEEGVLTVELGAVGSTFVASKVDGYGVRYGAATNDKSDRTISLKLKLPAGYTESEEQADGSEPTPYHIIYGDVDYLKDNGEDARATFAEEETESTFAFLQPENTEEDKLLFAVVSVLEDDDYRYLTIKGTNLVFLADEDDRVNFQWGKLGDYTALKAINTSSAKIYGVAGGVKVANANGAVAIYTIDGRLVTTQAVTSPDQTITVPAGIYIVKNGVSVAKVVVK